MRSERHDVVVVGGGVAGVSAALESFDIQLDVALVEAGPRLGGQLAEDPNSIRNVPAGRFESGEAFRQALEESAAILGDRVFVSHAVTAADLEERWIEANGVRFVGEALLVATGARKQHLPAATDGAFGGDVTYLLESQGDRFEGRTVAVIGGGDSATLDALELARKGSKVKLIHRSQKLTARRDILRELETEPGIEDLPGWEFGVRARDGSVGGDRSRCGQGRSTSGLPCRGVGRQDLSCAVDRSLFGTARARSTWSSSGRRGSSHLPHWGLRGWRRGVRQLPTRRHCNGSGRARREMDVAIPGEPRIVVFGEREIGPEAGAPWVTEIVAEFRRACSQREREERGPLMERLVELHRTNLAQWALEDTVRGPGATDATVARAKREIDVLNSQRHRLIEDADAAISKVMTLTLSAPPSTETPAMVCDRLSVLVIRVHHTELASHRAAPEDTGYLDRLPNLHVQLEVLKEALGVLLEDFREGRRRFVPYRSFKLYGT